MKSKLAEMDVTLEEIYEGAMKYIDIKRYRVCDECEGRGGKDAVQCSDCKGKGSVEKYVQIGLGMVAKAEVNCEKCQGTGMMITEENKCPKC